MPYNKVPRLRDPHTRDFVLEVRDRFMEEYKSNPDLYYNEDVKLVEETQFLMQRCIISKKKNVNESLNMLIAMLKWRKERRLRELCDHDFPAEYFTCGAAFLYEPDKFGNRTLYIRTALLKAIPELKASLKEYIAYLMYQVDDAVNGNTWSVVVDLTNTGWQHYDIDLLMHFLSLLKDYFPVNVDYILAVNFPWILSTAWAVVKQLIPPERRDVVIFIPSKEIFNYVEKENVPDFLNGSCQREHSQAPKSCSSVVQYLLSQEDPKLSVKRIREIVKSLSDLFPKEKINCLLKELEEKTCK